MTVVFKKATVKMNQPLEDLADIGDFSPAILEAIWIRSIATTGL